MTRTEILADIARIAAELEDALDSEGDRQYAAETTLRELRALMESA